MSKFVKVAFMTVAFGSAAVAGVNAVVGNVGIALAALAVSLVCAGYPVVKTQGWK